MAIATVNRSVSCSIQGQNPTYEINYQVETNANEGPKTVRDHVIAALGGLGAAFSYGADSDPNAFLNSVNVRQVSDDGATWEATASYSANENNNNPFVLEPEISIDWQLYDIALDRDVAGTAIRNSAGDPFNDPLYRQKSYPIIKATLFEQTYPLTTAFALADTLNDSEWNGMASGTVLAKAPRSVRVSTVSGYAWQTSYEFYYQPDGWNASVLDNGFHYLDSSGERRKILVDDEPTSQPLPLDGDGNLLSPTGVPVYREFQIFPTTSFSAFNITFPSS
jgi:hypothetical protein